MTCHAVATTSDAVNATTTDMLRDLVAEQLRLAATELAIARMYVDIDDDAGLIYSIEAGSILYRATLEAVDGLKQAKKAGRS